MRNELINDEFELGGFELPELDENMEVVSPGQMLTQARTALGFSQKDIADQLKLRLILLVNIDNDIF